MSQSLQDYLLQQVKKKQLSADRAATYFETLNNLGRRSDVEKEYAIIGIACRFPGANSPTAYWQNLVEQKDLVGSFPKDRIDDVRYINQQTYEIYGNMQCRVGGYLSQIDQFDHTFFKITPAEAKAMDPSQRLFLEVAVEALEDAGLTEEKLKGSLTGVFVGYSVNEDNYIDILSKNDPNMALGNQPSLLAYRLAFLYDMHGPTMVVDTACSSSLVAIHQACQSIASEDCDQAIVGGVNIRIYPGIREISNLGIEAFDGRCKTFDESANGTNIGEGVAALIVKRKDLALKDGDQIYALIRGSAVNSDGCSNGLTAPNPESQATAIRKAWERANIHPDNVSLIETHGTGTKLGDPIEILGLTHAFAEKTTKKQYFPLGAVKTNIGHLEAAAGLAGLIKAILVLKHRFLPPNIHYTKPNSYIDFANSPGFPARSAVDWQKTTDKMYAGISAFGLSGTNCHLVVEEYQKIPNTESIVDKTPLIFLFSAMQTQSLRQLAVKYLEWISQHMDRSPRDVAYTLARGRNHYEKKIAIVASTMGELHDRLQSCIDTSEEVNCPEGSFYQKLPLPEKTPDLVRLYFQNALISWSRYFPEGYGRIISLPTYAFHHRRHWPTLELEKTKELSSRQRMEAIFYELNWVQEDKALSARIVSEQCFLLFMFDDERHRDFADYLKNQGVQFVKVFPAQEFKVLEDGFGINPLCLGDYEKLLQAAVGSNMNKWGGAIHLWDCTPVTREATTDWQVIVTSQNQGAFALFHLIDTVHRIFPVCEWKLINVTYQAQKITEKDGEFNPYRMPSLGINKVASQEFPLLKSLAIDTDFDREAFPSICNEIFNVEGYQDAVIGYRGRQRYAQVLSKKDISLPPPREHSIRKDGVYFIAGGAGYLGLATARLLAEKQSVKIALAGRKERTSLTKLQLDQIQDIENLGSEIIYMRGDVTDREQCQDLIDDVVKKWGTIHGIFLAIKNISHQRLEDVSFSTFSSNILAKLQGAWLLDVLTEKIKLDFMLTFSSISSLTGGPTGADCCASNLFLDSFGDWRNAKGRITITMNYTLIEDDGSLLSDRMSMIPPLTKQEYLACMELCLTKKIDFAIMVDFNSRVMNLVLPFMKIRFADDLLTLFKGREQKTRISDGQKALSDWSLTEITELLQRIWSEVLGLEQIHKEANFFAEGGDSISAIKLLHLTKAQLECELEISDLYSYPVLQDLAKHIENKRQNTPHAQTLEMLLQEFESGKTDIHQTTSAYEQLH